MLGMRWRHFLPKLKSRVEAVPSRCYTVQPVGQPTRKRPKVVRALLCKAINMISHSQWIAETLSTP